MFTKTVKTRAGLIAALKGEGFAGPFTLDGVKSFVEDAGIEIPDLDKIWAKTVTITVGADGGERVEVKDATQQASQGEGEGQSEDKPDPNAQKIARLEAQIKSLQVKAGGDAPVSSKAYNAVTAEESSTTMTKAVTHRRIADRKRYDAEAAQGKTAFACSEDAELFGASTRLAIDGLFGGNINYSQKAMDREIVGKVGSSVVNSTGGALIPEIFNASLIYLTEPFGVARQLANVQQMKSTHEKFPRKTGIVTMSHQSENGTYTATDNSYDNVQLTVKDVGCLVRLSTRLFENTAVSIADDYARTFVEAQQRREDQDYFLGDGTSTYGGHSGLVTQLPASAYLSTAGSWSAVTLSHLHTAMGAVENVDPSRLKWVMSRQAFHQVALRLAYGTARGSVDNSIASVNPDQRGGMLLGVPVFFSQTMPTVTASTSTFAYYGDFMGASMLGDRRSLRVTFSEHRYLDNDQVAFLATAQIAVNIHGDGKGSTYGPVVALKTT